LEVLVGRAFAAASADRIRPWKRAATSAPPPPLDPPRHPIETGALGHSISDGSAAIRGGPQF